jgi:hypothetical protein
MSGRTYVTLGFGASPQVTNLRADLRKCLSANISTHRHLFREQLKKRRDLKGGFIMEEEDMQEILAGQHISYGEINRGKRCHTERLLPQMRREASGDAKTRLLNHYYHKERSGSIEFAYSEGFARSITDCSRGYRTVDKDALLSLRSRYSRLFFIYLSGESDRFQFREETLREMFGIRDHYKRIGSLKKRLDSVRKEFSKLGLDFKWEFRNGNLHIEAAGMKSYRCSRKQEESGERPRELSGEAVDFLKTRVKMSSEGIKANKKTFLDYIFYFGEKGLADFLMQKMNDPESWKKRNRTGWLIGAVKGELEKERSTGRAEGKQSDIDHMKTGSPRIREHIDRILKKLDSLDSS